MSRSLEQCGAGTACRLCARVIPRLSRALAVCGDCLHSRPGEALPLAAATHASLREAFGLPAKPPRAADGIRCSLCAQECALREGERGFCGLRMAEDGRLIHLAGTPRRGLLHWYRDPLPTNCVADWACEGSSHRGQHNLAVFYNSCTADCLFCQNWHFRRVDPRVAATLSAASLSEVATRQTFCVCFFGGDPASQMPHALAAGRALAGKGARVCWETNGSMHPRLLDAALDLSIQSGGCVKFDLKSYDENLHLALTGISNRRTLDNFARAARRFGERPNPPPVVASTLLVPRYVEADEVERIAGFIAGIEPRVPYALLGFAPHFAMADLPATSLSHALGAEAVARRAGLRDVRIGNRHLLRPE